MEKIIKKSECTYILREGDKQVRHTISHKQYFALSRYYNVDKYIEDLLNREMDKLKKTIMPYDI
jgi:hypothetical protein